MKRIIVRGDNAKQVCISVMQLANIDTVTELSRAAGLSQPAITRILAGDRQMRTSTLCKLANVVGAKVYME